MYVLVVANPCSCIDIKCGRAQVSLVARTLRIRDTDQLELGSLPPVPGSVVGAADSTARIRKGVWYDKLNEEDVVGRRNQFLARMYALLLEEEVFCKNTASARVRLMSQESRYNYNNFLKTDCYGGGTTYMDTAHANKFVRVHNDNINNPAFRVSVRAEGEADIKSERECVWQCIIEVICWWQTHRPGRTGQSILSVESLRTIPGYVFMVGGGPLLHVLVALYYAFFRQDSLGVKHTELAVESYGTKKLKAVAVQEPNGGINGTEDPRVKEVIRDLEVSLEEVAPMQLKRLKAFLDKHYTMDGGACDLVWGIGCTLRCAASEGQRAWPVVQCGDVPWKGLLEQGDPTKFFAETATVKGHKKLFPFVPLQSRDVETWPIYSVLPLCMQPTTFTAKSKWESALGGRGRAQQLCSGSFRRWQQYNVSARFAAGECGLQRKSTAHLSEIPAQVTRDGNQLTVNLAIVSNRVKEFQSMAKAHLASMGDLGGGWARIEIAVPVPVVSREDDAASSEFGRAVHDAIFLAQNNTAAYDMDKWATMIEFFVSALSSRVRCTVDMMAHLSQDPREDVLKQDELADYVLEVNDVIKRFYNGVGCLRSTVRSLPRCAYMYDRAILGRMRKFGRMQCNQLTSCGGTDWVERFYEKLGMTKADAIPIPDYVPAQRHRRFNEREEGFACPNCWNLYRMQDKYAYQHHPCQGRSSYEKWVQLSSARFKKHHADVLQRLSDEQRLLIELLDDPALNPNVYLGGLAGVGKSFALRAAVEHICMNYGMKAIAIVAPTHIAAQNVGGRTIHSFLGLTHHDGLVPKSEEDLNRVVTNYLKNKDEKAKELQNNLQFFVVDEVGMLSAKTLELLEYFLRSLKRTGLEGEEVGNFGDIRVLLVGDPLQVPPVEIESGGGYFFESAAFTARESRFVTLYLKKIFRTPNVLFANFQARARLGYDYLTQEHIVYANRVLGALVSAQDTGWLEEMSKELHALFLSEMNSKRELDAKLNFFFCMKVRMLGKYERKKKLQRTRLTLAPGVTVSEGTIPEGQMPYTICVENVEGEALDKLYLRSFQSHELMTLEARDEGGPLPASAKLKQHLTLAVGMRVKVLTNHHAPMVVSNSVVDVVHIDPARVTVRVPLPKGGAAEVEMGPVEERCMVGERTTIRVQFPLTPCGSGTTYQVQGQTLHKRPCVYNNERIKRGDNGQAYTVVSRHTDPAFIKALHDWHREDFRAAEVAIRFDQFHAQHQNCVSNVTYSFPFNTKTGKRTPVCHLQQEQGKRCPCLMCCGPKELLGRTLSALETAEMERERLSAVSSGPAELEEAAGWEGDGEYGAHIDEPPGGVVAASQKNKKRKRVAGDAAKNVSRRQRKKAEPTGTSRVPIVCVGELEWPDQVEPKQDPWDQRATKANFTHAEVEWIVWAYAALTSTAQQKETRKARREVMAAQLEEEGETLGKALTEFEQLYYIWNQRFNWGVAKVTDRRPLTLQALTRKVHAIRKPGSGIAEAVMLSPEKAWPEEVYRPYTDIYVTKANRVYCFEEENQTQEHCLSTYIRLLPAK
jgi:hypothetical protein